jgi:vacuolar-type H+-ATPase subunit I/STV1
MKIDALKNIDGLSELDDSVLKRIITIAKNHEKIAVENAIDTTFNEVKAQLKNGGFDFDGGLQELSKGIKGLVDGGNKTELQDKLNKLQADYESLKKSGSSDETLKKQVADLEDQLKSTKKIFTEYKESSKSELDKVKETYEKQVKNLQLDTTLSDFKFREDIGDDLRSIAIENAKNKFNSTYKAEIRNGNTVYINAETNEVMYDKTTAEPLREVDLIKPFVKSIIDERKPQGTGSSRNPDGRGGVPFSLKSSKNKSEAFNMIDDYLIKDLGLKHGTAEYNEKAHELITSSEYTELPT